MDEPKEMIGYSEIGLHNKMQQIAASWWSFNLEASWEPEDFFQALIDVTAELRKIKTTEDGWVDIRLILEGGTMVVSLDLREDGSELTSQMRWFKDGTKTLRMHAGHENPTDYDQNGWGKVAR